MSETNVTWPDDDSDGTQDANVYGTVFSVNCGFANLTQYRTLKAKFNRILINYGTNYYSRKPQSLTIL